jgi:OFA family oxalate/formate antiporter-like MFS transporter
VTAGIAIIANLSNMAQEQLGIGPVVAGSVVLASSLCNGFGRLFWAHLSEKIGRRNVFLALFATQVPLFLLLPRVNNLWLFSLLACYILLCYGGGFGTMPSFTADTFGPRHIGSVYGKILFAWGVAGVVGPMLMEWVKKQSSSYAGALYIAAALLGAGLVLGLMYRKPRFRLQASAASGPAR